MRLVVLASGRGSNLLAIAHAIDAGHCSATLAAVVSDKADAAALDLARQRGVPADVVPLAKGDDRSAWSARLAETVAGHAPDLVVLAGFMRVLAPTFIDRFEGRIVNVHPALLPSFPGHDGPAQAIRAGVRISGCTVHLVDRGVDTGAILAQAAVPVLPSDDVATLHARIQRVEHELFPRVIDWIARGALALDPPRIVARAIDDGNALVAPTLEG
jgi:phosphoribosylglycinamide formyltransferase 1